MTGFEPFADADLTRDAMLGGRVTLLQPRSGYRAATDPVFLAALVPASPGERVLDIGCGSGAAFLCLGARVPGLDLHGLELQPAYAELARRNAAANGQTTTIHCGDLLRPPPSLRVLPFDHVLMNPPFHERAGARSPNAGRATARNEGEAGLADWIAAGLRRLRPGGSLCLIQRADRLAEILAALVPAAGAIEILPLAARAGSPAGRVLVRARKASRASLVLHAPLDVHAAPLQGAANESFTPAASRILRDAAPVLSDSRNGGSSLQGATRE